MLVERPITWSCLGLSAAIALPEISRMIQNSDKAPGNFLFLAIIVGSIGFYLACLMAVSHINRLGRIIRLVLWELLAIIFAFVIGFFAYRSHIQWQSVIFIVLIFVHLTLNLLALIRIKRDNLLE